MRNRVGHFIFTEGIMMNNDNTIEVKPALTIEEQVNKLKERGLIIPDEPYAQSVLSRINYYRFTGYLLPYKVIDTDTYISGTSFEQAYNLYEFDTKLRQLLMNLSEYIEISMRTYLSYHLALKYDPECYRNKDHFNFKDEKTYKIFIDKIDRELLNSKELYVSHYRNKYNGRFPIWLAVEAMSFANLSILYANLKPKDKRAISRNYKLKKHQLLDNWLHSLCVLRNRCAHYNRIYYMRLSKAINLSLDARKLHISPNSLYALIFTLKYLVQDYSTWNQWIIRLASLIEEYNHVVDLTKMGFINDWEKYLRSIPTDIYSE
jgi:abortive infection bacteriophage resistance protein